MIKAAEANRRLAEALSTEVEQLKDKVLQKASPQSAIAASPDRIAMRRQDALLEKASSDMLKQASFLRDPLDSKLTLHE